MEHSELSGTPLQSPESEEGKFLRHALIPLNSLASKFSVIDGVTKEETVADKSAI